MISIDAVYQKVLALASKEQRGYITPQEFNLFAKQSQLEILNQYYYDISQFNRIPGNNTDYSDMVDLIREKLGALLKGPHLLIGTIGGVIQPGVIHDASHGWFHPFPDDLYKLGTVTKGASMGGIAGYQLLDQISYSEAMNYQKSRLTMFTYVNQAYTIMEDSGLGGSGNKGIFVHGYPNSTYGANGLRLTYTKIPQEPKWGYIVIGDTALYNLDNSTDFELHPSEEPELVYKILKLSGISIQREDVATAAQSIESSLVQQEKQ
tara:strand:- start:5274 stop:6065 length:792 start_codon:yes stop_codon:yes gene_type:complete